MKSRIFILEVELTGVGDALHEEDNERKGGIREKE